MEKTIPLILICFFTAYQLSAQFTVYQLECGAEINQSNFGDPGTFRANSYVDCYNGPYQYGGPERVFAIKKESDVDRLTINLFSEGSHDLDIFLFGASFNECLASSVNLVENDQNMEVIFDTDQHLPAGTYHIVVDGYNVQQSGDFRISASCGSLACHFARKVDCGTTLIQESNVSASNEISAFKLNDELIGGNTGPENIYYFDLFFPEEVSIRLNNFAPDDNFELILLSDCDEYQAIAAGTEPSGESEEIKTLLDPGRYFILVEGYDGTTGTYDLSIDWNCREDVETGPIPIHCGELLEGNTVGFNNDFDIFDYVNCFAQGVFNGYEYKDALYRFDLAESQTIQIELEMLTEFLNLDLFLMESSYLPTQPELPIPGSCITIGDQLAGNKKALFENLRAGTYWIGIDGGVEGFITGPGPAEEGLFTLRMNCFDLPAPCDLDGEFITNGNTLFTQAKDTLQAIYFTDIACLENQFPDSLELIGGVYTYYSEENATTTVQLKSDDLRLKAFVFECGTVQRELSCLGRTGYPARTIIFEAQADHYYQIIVMGNKYRQEYQLSILTPPGPCSNDLPQVLRQDEIINGTLAGSGNDLDISNGAFYQNCSSGDLPYDGEDRVFQLDVQLESGTEVDQSGKALDGANLITLEAESAMGLFLFAYQCGAENCLAKIELPPGGGKDFIDLNDYITKAGTYYLVLDKASDSGSNSFTLTRNQRIIFNVGCNPTSNEIHVVNFANDILTRQKILEKNDILYVDHKNKTYIGEIHYEPYIVFKAEDVNESIPSINLIKQDSIPSFVTDTVAVLRCGFEDGDLFEFKVLKNDGRIITLEPIFDEDEIFADPPDAFAPGLVTRVKDLRIKGSPRPVKVDFEPGSVNLNALPSDGILFESHIDVNDHWEIEGLLSSDWIRLYDAKQGVVGAPITQGQDAVKVLVQIDENLNGELRQKTFEIVTDNGVSRRVIIKQLPNPCSSLFMQILDESTDISCYGEANGRIALNSPINQNLEFIWEDGADGVLRTNLSAGDYRVSISDQADCQTLFDYTINEPDPLHIAIDTIQAERRDTLGTIAVNVTGGTAPYTYYWTWADGFRLTNVPNSGGLSSGTYQVRVEDANGCTVVLENVVIDQIVPTKDLFFDNSLKIYPNPGTGIFHLQWQSPLKDDISVKVHDILGNEVWLSDIPNSNRTAIVNLKEHPPGIYFIVLNDRYSQSTYKLVIE